ncbi:MAG: DNA ligase (NAD(+)) LigA, partial [Treponema sp.]|nr:DNA ligase (NAD(+)) LigA [Treponema sp.]
MDNLFDDDELDKAERISKLSKLVKKYQDSYYNGEAEISDFEFDKLWDELRSLDPENPLFKKVGADGNEGFSGTFPKASHRMMMGSQEKASNPEEFLKWASSHEYDEYLVEYKLDGASLELQFDNGVLV